MILWKFDKSHEPSFLKYTHDTHVKDHAKNFTSFTVSLKSIDSAQNCINPGLKVLTMIIFANSRINKNPQGGMYHKWQILK